MKKVFNFMLLTLFLVSTINANATSYFLEDPFEECTFLGELDYELHGDFEQAVGVYNDCVDETLD